MILTVNFEEDYTNNPLKANTRLISLIGINEQELLSFQLKSTTKVVITKFLGPTFAKPKRTCEKSVIKNDAPLCGIKRKF